MSSLSIAAHLKVCLVAAVSGLTYGLAWRSHEAGPIGLIGLALFFALQSQLRCWWTVLLSSLITGATAYLIACSWLSFTIHYLSGSSETTAQLIAPLACLVQAGHFGLFGLSWHLARKWYRQGWTLAPLLWVAVEEVWPGFFPCKVGNLLVEWPAMCQLASFGGATLVSFQAACMAGWLAVLGIWCWTGWKQQQWQTTGFKLVATGGAAIIFLQLLGADRMESLVTQSNSKSPQQSNELRVLLVQVDTENPDRVARMIEVCNQFRGKIDLFIWPECALENYPQALSDFLQPREYVDAAGLSEVYHRFYPNPPAAILAGGDSWIPNPDADDGRTIFVSAFLINAQEQIVGRHDKIHLMPYGEHIPGEQWLPVLRHWFGRERKIAAGTRYRPIGEVKGVQLGAVLCCEDMHPDACRELVNQGANIIITLGSGAAFDNVIPLRQHFRIAQMRAIENGTYFIRCSSRGISGFIAPSGEVIGLLPAMQDLATPLEIPVTKLRTATFYTRWGYGLGYGVIVLLSAAIIAISPRSNGYWRYQSPGLRSAQLRAKLPSSPRGRKGKNAKTPA